MLRPLIEEWYTDDWKQNVMPTHFGKDAKGCFAQWGSQAKYYYACGNTQAKAGAKSKADRQGRAAYAGGYRGDRSSGMKPQNIDIENLTIIDLSQSKIDKENNIIKRVAFLADKAYNTNGEVFRIFTDRALDDAVEIFEGALARIDHDRENQSAIESRGVKSSYGVYQDIKREGNTIFGDLHLWDCENARKVMSIAERTPNAVGNSIHAGGKMTINKDNIEVVEQLTPRTTYGYKPSIDLVEDPAATISLFQDRRVKLKSESKEKEMEFKDLTQELVRTNRPDLEKIFMDEGKKSRDEEVEKLEQERDNLTKELDELKVKQTGTEREILVSKVLADSELPDYAKTDAFRTQLLGVKETKDGDKTVSIEDGIKALIQDRIDVLDPGGVTDNTEKGNVTQGRRKEKVSTEDFVDAFKQ